MASRPSRGRTRALSAVFAKERLKEIFKIDPEHSGRLISRESTTVEFKRNFNKGSKLNEYGRTMAAFANAQGGYLVFGVGANPRTLDGMSNDRFETMDPEELTGFLNQKFSPAIQWEPHLHRRRGKRFGMIYVHESVEKPVIATAEGGEDIHEGEIYYRYRGRSQRVRYPELRSIVEGERQKEASRWLRHFQRIAEIGARDAAVFDLATGTVEGTGGTFVIDRDLLPKLRFIREGEFKEVSGAPAIKLVGEAQALAAGHVHPIRTRLRPTAIHWPEIVDYFLRQETPDEPAEFLRAVAYESSAYLPIYHFMLSARMSLQQAIELIQKTPKTAPARGKLLERLGSEDLGCQHALTNSDTKASRSKRALRQRILSREAPEGLATNSGAQSRTSIMSSIEPE